MEIYYATRNPGKVNSLQRDLTEYGIKVIQRDIKLIEPRSDDLKKIATAKINQAYPLIKKPTVVVDAGFYIPSLKGFPDSFVNFALETIGLKGILKLVEGEGRECEFVDCLAYLDETLREPAYFSINTKGIVSREIRGERKGNAWSELWKIFIPLGCEKTFAEMSLEELAVYREKTKGKNTLGHQLGKWLSKHHNLHPNLR